MAHNTAIDEDGLDAGSERRRGVQIVLYIVTVPILATWATNRPSHRSPTS